ncbi:aspartyl-tRNA synthetase [Evansella sp. LMS18]|jgi:hypothetical protein|uniref:aspartyl-tRNA synthetase n=1 Tax=Evansella sp. LMS18 TaxID=2924033 RepID=UPI0020D1E023|nr:aspartyl-tRNA synthetase [Evansella sp. LMS18]UTR12652.1 aspartyl-tRNA synthetase [Evansella sp. LMS18]
MKNIFYKRTVASITAFIILIGGVWLFGEKSSSYPEPNEAVFAAEEELVLIPAYKLNKEALFFFINSENRFGAVSAHEGLFGWQAGPLTWGSLYTGDSFADLNGYQIHEGELVYGLIENGLDRQVMIGDRNAVLLNLASLSPETVEEYELEGLYLWYLEGGNFDGEEIRLIDSGTGEVIDTMTLN